MSADPRLVNATEYDSATMWNAAADFVNARGGSKFDVEGFSIRADPPGWVSAAYRRPSTWVVFAGRKADNYQSRLALQEFPYDIQLAQIVLESEHTNETLRWIPSPTLTSGLLPKGLEMDGWDLIRAYTQVSDFYYPALEESYNRLTMVVRVRRQSAYYVTRIVANVVLLVIMVRGTGAACVAYAHRGARVQGGCVAFLRGTEADRLG